MNAMTFAAIGGFAGLVGVALGAFGAHALKARLPADLLAIYETANRYHMYHALALVALGALAPHLTGSAVRVAGWAMVGGIVIFSGSLYLLSATGVRWLGAITPIGGLAFMVGWAALGVGCWMKSRH